MNSGHIYIYISENYKRRYMTQEQYPKRLMISQPTNDRKRYIKRHSYAQPIKALYRRFGCGIEHCEAF